MLICIKNWGKLLNTLNLTEWRAVVPELLLVGLRAKFDQVAHCRAFLSSKRGLTLAEASVSDRYFGIGMGINSDATKLTNEANWGYNLLGKCLMSIRSDL